MKRAWIALASLRASLAGFAVLAAALLCEPLAVVPALALVAANLAAAIAQRPALRRGGLGLFHAALLALLLLAGWGRLVHFDGRVEVTEGTTFDAGLVDVVARGAWHDDAWRRIEFLQGGWSVDYAPGMRRARTRSSVLRPGESEPRTVGDDTPLVIDGYRFYTTHNKGFAPLLTWQADGAAPVQGALHMPAYPLFDWKQENRWTAPDGRALAFWLRLARPPSGKSAWTLDPGRVDAVLVVDTGAARHELRPGESVRLGSATLRYERLTGWMGYRIFYDPTLAPMLVAAVLGVLGLAWHLWGRTPTLAPARRSAAA